MDENMGSKDEGFGYHPIQLRKIEVLELNFSKYSDDVEEKDRSHFNFMHAHSALDQETNFFNVKVRAEVYPPDLEEEYKIVVEIAGAFEVNLESFDVEHVDSFAEKNAPLILYPFLREQVFGVAARAGVTTPTLPLFQIPPFVLSKTKQDS